MRTTLGEIAIEGGIQTGPFGSQLHASDYTSAGVGVVMPQDLRGNVVSLKEIAFVSPDTAAGLERHALRAGDIVYSRRGDITRRALIRDDGPDFICGTGCLRVRIDSEVADPAFVSYFLGLSTTHEWLHQHAVGATMPNLNTSILSAVPIELPGLPVQCAIGEVLGALDDKIAANRRIIEVGDQLIYAIVRGASMNRLPMSEAFTFKFGEAFKGEHFSEPGTGRPLIRIRDLKGGKCQIWTKESRRNETLAKPGTLLVGMDAEFRAMRWAGPPALVNQRVMSVSSDKYGNAVSMVALAEPLRLIERSKVATTVIHLNKSDLAIETVAVPTDDQVAVVRSTVDPLYDRAIAASLENAWLAHTRDELLPLLMSGRITVEDAERAVEGVI